MTNHNQEKVLIQVNYEDLQRMEQDCKEIFLKYHPELRGMFLSRSFLFNKLVNFYIETV